MGYVKLKITIRYILCINNIRENSNSTNKHTHLVINPFVVRAVMYSLQHHNRRHLALWIPLHTQESNHNKTDNADWSRERTVYSSFSHFKFFVWLFAWFFHPLLTYHDESHALQSHLHLPTIRNITYIYRPKPSPIFFRL